MTKKLISTDVIKKGIPLKQVSNNETKLKASKEGKTLKETFKSIEKKTKKRKK